MADSFALVGQGKLRDAIGQVATSLQHSLKSDQLLDDEKILESVQVLTQVGAALNAWAAHPENFDDEIQIDQNQNSYELETAREALLAEARTDIEHIKESVVDFINSQWDREIIKSLPADFYQLSGALKIIELDRSAAILDGCGIYVQQHLINSSVTDQWQLLDNFADTITIVEYYLEQLSSGTQEDQHQILEDAEDKIDALLELAIEQGQAQSEPVQTTPADPPARTNYQPTEAVDQEIIEIFFFGGGRRGFSCTAKQIPQLGR